MKTSFKTLLAAGVLSFAALAGTTALADDIPVTALPPHIVEAIVARWPTAQFVKAEREKEDNGIRYEVEIKVNGEEVDVELAADGRIVEIND